MSDTISPFRRPYTGILLLASALGGPYFLFETETGRFVRHIAVPSATSSVDAPPEGHLTSVGGSASGASPEFPWQNTPAAPETNILNAKPDTFPAPPIVSLPEALRFDVTPAWVTSRFPRVSTIAGEPQLDAMRVPLVTGTSPGDMAGTLTYYFDAYQRLQRISLQSVTGDPNRFVSELQQAYKLEQQPSLGGALYLMSWNGKATSVLRISPAAIIRSDSPYSRFEVFLELNQPGLQFGLSREANSLLAAGRATGRW
ncbi:MAG TPA: hypothetical protein DDW52_17315 [Planctomycetaceae bacterium]|nr:hypothetical protein [Planctomycetaceae bacterium]